MCPQQQVRGVCVCVWTAQLIHRALKVTCVCVCSQSPNRHLNPVWQLRWTQQELNLTGDEMGESLFSVAADGRISRWFICSSGLDCTGTKLCTIASSPLSSQLTLCSVKNSQ